MNRFRIMSVTVFLAFAALSIRPLSRALADHTVYLDFETQNFNLNRFGIRDRQVVEAVKKLILMEMCRDFAAYEIHFFIHEPPRGKFTRVIFGGLDPEDLNFGVADGIGTWVEEESICYVFSDEYSSYREWRGRNATVPRIVNAIAGTASHELGHVLGLDHPHAFDDFPGTTDPDVTRHIMITHIEADVTFEDYATGYDYFSPHISDEKLMKTLGARAYYNPLQNVDGDERGRGVLRLRRADLVYGRYLSPSRVAWYMRHGDGNGEDNWFSDYETWCRDGGDAGDIFLLGDVTGDKKADIVYGRPVSSRRIVWYVRRSEANGFGRSGFGRWEWWCDDAGDVGDIFRLGDVTGDGMADLVYGRANVPERFDYLTWYVRPSLGDTFTEHYQTWGSGARFAKRGDSIFLSDVDADGDADLIRAYPDDGFIVWEVNRSLADRGVSLFGLPDSWGNEDLLDSGRRLLVADLDGDGAADLAYGRLMEREIIRWYGRPLGDPLAESTIWNGHAGDAGDYFRVGDVDGDGMADLLYRRRFSRRHTRWYARRSLGDRWGGFRTICNDAGDEGDIFP